MQASVVNVLQLNAEKARPPLPFIAIEALLMLLPFAYLQVQTSSFFRYTFSSHYLEFHISIFRRNIFTRHRAYNVDSTTYAYVRVATGWSDCRNFWRVLATYAYMRVATREIGRMIAREAWQHTLTCELRRRRPTGPPGALPRWQHTLTCELRHEDEATAQAIIDLATYAYVRVATPGLMPV